MELLLGSTVLAALITSLVNIRSIFLASKTAKDLEVLKKSFETTQIAVEKIEGIKKYILKNNITSISQGLNPSDPDEYSDFIYNKVPTMFTKNIDKIKNESHYFKRKDMDQILDIELKVRDSFKSVIDASKESKKEAVQAMLLKVAGFNEFTEAKIEEILIALMKKIGIDE